MSKVLQPEINRLNLLHEREMGDIEQQAHSAEREVRELYTRRLQQVNSIVLFVVLVVVVAVV